MGPCRALAPAADHPPHHPPSHTRCAGRSGALTCWRRPGCGCAARCGPAWRPPHQSCCPCRPARAWACPRCGQRQLRPGFPGRAPAPAHRARGCGLPAPQPQAVLCLLRLLRRLGACLCRQCLFRIEGLGRPCRAAVPLRTAWQPGPAPQGLVHLWGAVRQLSHACGGWLAGTLRVPGSCCGPLNACARTGCAWA